MTAITSDLYSGYDGVCTNSDQTPAGHAGHVTQTHLMTGPGGMTAANGRVGTGKGRLSSLTGTRVGTGAGVAVDGRRPVTAVTAAGYTSCKSPPWRSGSGGARLFSHTRMSSPMEVCKALEIEVHASIEEAAELLQQGLSHQGHDVAQKAVLKVEDLHQQCDAAGIQDNAIVDLQFAVRMCLAQCAQAAGMDQEALALYTAIAKNSDFQMACRVRANIGNIFAMRGHWTEAIKQYRMALDQIPTERQGMYADARDNFEAVLRVRPDIVSAFNRLVASFMVTKTVEQADSLKSAFKDILFVPQLHDTGLGTASEDACVQVDGQVDYQSTAHSNLVLTAAKLIAPRLEPGDVEAGFQWCLDELFKAKLDRLAHDVMMAKATYFLTTAEVDKAAQVLKQFEKHGGSMRFKAATNLSFLYLLEGNITEAQRYAHLALSHDEFHVQALVNSGNCFFELALSNNGDRDGNLTEAWSLYERALRQEPDCVEAIYNMGLVAKAMEQYDLALEQLVMLNGMIANEVEVLYQIADSYMHKGDRKRARKMLHLTYDFIGSEPGIMARLGTLCAELNQRDDSMQFLLQAHEQFPSIDTLAVVCAHFVNDEKYDTAARYFEQAALMQPSNPQWLLMVASCYRRAHNSEMALEVYEKVHQQHPNSVEALKFMVQLAEDLEDESKRVTYEAALIKVERIVAVQDHMPGPNGKQAAMQVPSITAQSAQYNNSKVGADLIMEQGQWSQQDFLPDLPSPGTVTGYHESTVAAHGPMPFDILGEDLLPGLGDI